MYVSDIHGALISHLYPRLGLHVYWKHTLETLSFGNIICIWKQKMYIGNMHWILETKIGYWKHKKAFGNIICILETSLSFGNTRILETYNEKSLTESHVKYTIISRNVYDLLKYAILRF